MFSLFSVYHCQLLRQLTHVGQTYGMLSAAGFSRVDVLLISFCLHGVENRTFLYAPPLCSYPPSLIPNCLLFLQECSCLTFAVLLRTFCLMVF